MQATQATQNTHHTKEKFLKFLKLFRYLQKQRKVNYYDEYNYLGLRPRLKNKFELYFRRKTKNYFKIIDLIKNLPNLDYIETQEDDDHDDEGHIYFRYHFLDWMNDDKYYIRLYGWNS